MDLKQFAKEELLPQTAPDDAPDRHWYLLSRSQRQEGKGWAASDRPYPENPRGFLGTFIQIRAPHSAGIWGIHPSSPEQSAAALQPCLAAGDFSLPQPRRARRAVCLRRSAAEQIFAPLVSHSGLCKNQSFIF